MGIAVELKQHPRLWVEFLVTCSIGELRITSATDQFFRNFCRCIHDVNYIAAAVSRNAEEDNKAVYFTQNPLEDPSRRRFEVSFDVIHRCLSLTWTFADFP